MGIADIRNTLTEALRPIGSVSSVKMKYDQGGRQQVITFTLTAPRNKAKNTTSNETLVVPSSTPLIAGLQQAAAVFVANFQQEHAP